MMARTTVLATLRFTAVSALLLIPAALLAQPGGSPGAFTRLGFGARGMGMGNALSAVRTGIISSLYNPALTPFQADHLLYANYSILSLDRKLNQISYTQSIRLRKAGASKFENEPDVLSISGVSAGWTNAGDADIQGYDSDGFKTEMLSVFENQFYLNFGTRFTPKLSGGFNVKFYYSGLYKNVTSSGFGIDLGLLYSISEEVSVGFVIQELLTKYKWDTGKLYGPDHGNATENPFPKVYRLAAAYVLPGVPGVVDAEVEGYEMKTFLARAGVEVYPVDVLALRAGIERLDLSDKGIDPRPTFGVSFSQSVGQFMPAVNYAFILEPDAPSPTHVISLAFPF